MRLFQSQLKYSCVCSAWSLLELLIVLALMAILASLGLPQIYSAWHLQSLHDEGQKLAQQIRFARFTSLQKSAKVSLCCTRRNSSSSAWKFFSEAMEGPPNYPKQRKTSAMMFFREIKSGYFFVRSKVHVFK